MMAAGMCECVCVCVYVSVCVCVPVNMGVCVYVYISGELAGFGLLDFVPLSDQALFLSQAHEGQPLLLPESPQDYLQSPDPAFPRSILPSCLPT